MAAGAGGVLSYFNGMNDWVPGMTPNPADKKAAQSPLAKPYQLAEDATKRQTEDYGGIMSGYKSLFDKAQQTPQLQFQNYQPQAYTYTPSAHVESSLSGLKDLASTGGYSGSDIASLRERGISPIRAIYANANRDVDRQRALQGGFSPNYAAVKAKMAREQSDQIGGAINNVNAGLAERIAQNRLSAAPNYASAAGSENALRTQVGTQNTNAMNDAAKFNISMPLEYGKYNMGVNDQGLEALRGMTSLYGTTPAMSQLFGNQALQGAQFQQQINNQGNQGNLSTIAAAIANINKNNGSGFANGFRQ